MVLSSHAAVLVNTRSPINCCAQLRSIDHQNQPVLGNYKYVTFKSRNVRKGDAHGNERTGLKVVQSESKEEDQTRTLRSRPPPSAKIREHLHSQDQHLLSPSDSSFELITTPRPQKRCRPDPSPAIVSDYKTKDFNDHATVRTTDGEELATNAMSHLQQASARNLQNYTDSRNPVAVALWVAQKLDLVYQEKHNKFQPPHAASRASSVSSKAESPLAPVARPKTWSDTPAKERDPQREHRKQLQTARKQRQREDNWVKNKENDVVARVRHNKKKQTADAFDEADHSDTTTRAKRPKKTIADNDPVLRATINDSFDRAMSKTVQDIAPRLSDQVEFRRGTAEFFINDRQDQIEYEVWEAGTLLASVLPALTEPIASDESKNAANNLIDRLQSKKRPNNDDFFQALEVLTQSNVMVGVGIVISRLYPDRSRSLPETARTTKTRDSAPRPNSSHQQSIEGNDSDEYDGTMISDIPTRSSGRSRKQTKKYQEAYPGLISKRKRHTSTSPEATSPVSLTNQKRVPVKFGRLDGSPSDANSELDETEVNDDVSRDPTKPRPTRVTRSSGSTATNVTTVFKSSKHTNKAFSDSRSAQVSPNNQQVSVNPNLIVPQIQVSEDGSDMTRQDLVQNLINTMNEINEGLYDTDTDDDDREAAVGAVSAYKSLTSSGRNTRPREKKADSANSERPELSGRILRSAKSSKTSGFTQLARSSKPSPLKLTTNVDHSRHSNTSGSRGAVPSANQSLPHQPSNLVVNTIISAEEGKVASAYYAELAQQSHVAQGHPMSTGLSYPELIRPYTDKDGWTSTGVVNEFGEEVIHVDKNMWMIFDPLEASQQDDVAAVAPRRLKSFSQAAEDRVFGFPPRPEERKLPIPLQRLFRTEDVAYETGLYKARKAAERRHLSFDRSTTVETLTRICREFDLDKAQPPASASAEDEVTSVEGDGNPTSDSQSEMALKDSQVLRNGSQTPGSPMLQEAVVESTKPLAKASQNPPPVVGYSPVRRASDHHGGSVDLARPPASLRTLNSTPSSHAPSVSPGPSKAVLYKPSNQPHYSKSPLPQSPTPPSNFPTPPQQQKLTFLQPTDPSVQKAKSPRPAYPTPTASASANPDSPSPNSAGSTPTTRQAALNGGFPGGGIIINPRKKDEPPVYKKKIGPDYKMELTNGRLARPGPNAPPQPTPKRGGQIIDFTGF